MMTADDAIERLPATYASYLRLESAGIGDPEIAARLGVPPEALALLARLAHEKLRSLIDSVPDREHHLPG